MLQTTSVRPVSPGVDPPWSGAIAEPAEDPEVLPAARICLSSCFTANRRGILVVLGCRNAENLLRVGQPAVLRLAIDGLLTGRFAGLLALLAVQLLQLMAVCARRAYERGVVIPRTRQWMEAVTTAGGDAAIDHSRLRLREMQATGCIEYFRQHLPAGLRSLYSVAGALAFLGVYDWRLVPFCVALFVPAVLLGLSQGRAFDDDSGRGETDATPSAPFPLMELFGIGLTMAVLVLFCMRAAVSAGEIVAVVQYLLMLLQGMSEAPAAVSRLTGFRHPHVAVFRSGGRL